MKNCKGCNIKKELIEFYKHKLGSDGHLNKCKICVKNRVRNYYQDGRGKEVNRKRELNPARKLWHKNFAVENRKKHAAKRKVGIIWWNWFRNNKGVKTDCEVCGTDEKVEAHHPDYNFPFKVMWLCSKHHKEWHRNNEPIWPKENFAILVNSE